MSNDLNFLKRINSFDVSTKFENKIDANIRRNTFKKNVIFRQFYQTIRDKKIFNFAIMNKSIVCSQSKFLNVSDTNKIVRIVFVVRIFNSVNSCFTYKSRFYDLLILITIFFNNIIDDIFNKSKRFYAEKNEIYFMI